MAEQLNIAPPKIVRRMCDDLEEATGVRPETTWIDTRHIRLTHANDRVHMVINYVRGGAGKFKHGSSTLAVDGRQRDLAEDFDDYVQIFTHAGGAGSQE
jgi:hypothetical protein